MPEDNPNDAAFDEATAVPSIGDELTTFVEGITKSCPNTHPLTMTAISTAFKEARNKFQQFEKDKIIFREGDSGEENGKVVVSIRQDYLQEFRALDKQLRNHSLALNIVPRSFVVSLLQIADGLMASSIASAPARADALAVNARRWRSAAGVWQYHIAIN